MLDHFKEIEALEKLKESLNGCGNATYLAELQEEVLKQQAIAYKKQQEFLEKIENHKEPCYRCEKLLNRSQYEGQSYGFLRFYCTDCLLYSKICKHCKQLLNSSYFPRNPNTKDRLINTCFDCLADKKRNTVQNNVTSQDKALNQRLSKYGITCKEYLALYEEQKGLCAICKESDKIVIDHCHKEGKVRGLLCGNCNCAIGLFKDNIQFLSNAIDYIKNRTTDDENIMNITSEKTVLK